MGSSRSARRRRAVTILVVVALLATVAFFGWRPAVLVFHARRLDDPDPARRAVAAEAIARRGSGSSLARTLLEDAYRETGDIAIASRLGQLLDPAERLELFATVLGNELSIGRPTVPGIFGPVDFRLEGRSIAPPAPVAAARIWLDTEGCPGLLPQDPITVELETTIEGGDLGGGFTILLPAGGSGQPLTQQLVEPFDPSGDLPLCHIAERISSSGVFLRTGAFEVRARIELLDERGGPIELSPALQVELRPVVGTIDVLGGS